jgi:hypothetical protein
VADTTTSERVAVSCAALSIQIWVRQMASGSSRIGRLTRGFLAVGNRYTVLAGGGRQRTADHPDTDARPAEPVRALFRRGIAEGALRADLTPEMLSVLYSGLIKAALETTAGGRVGTEEASAAVITVFLRRHGASRACPIRDRPARSRRSVWRTPSRPRPSG